MNAVIIKTTAIPFAYYPYSSTSRIVHWITRHHGKVSTLLKGALRPKSPFLGEYELFGTSELLYFEKQPHGLHAGKECALLHPRPIFRTDWRAMQSASLLMSLFNFTTPVETPLLELFGWVEELLDYAELYGASPQYLLWAELQFFQYHGHTPNLKNCPYCGTLQNLVFASKAGGVVCVSCAKNHLLPTLPCPPDILSILRAWQRSSHPQQAIKVKISAWQQQHLFSLFDAFIQDQFDLTIRHHQLIQMP